MKKVQEQTKLTLSDAEAKQALKNYIEKIYRIKVKKTRIPLPIIMDVEPKEPPKKLETPKYFEEHSTTKKEYDKPITPPPKNESLEQLIKNHFKTSSTQGTLHQISKGLSNHPRFKGYEQDTIYKKMLQTKQHLNIQEKGKTSGGRGKPAIIHKINPTLFKKKCFTTSQLKTIPSNHPTKLAKEHGYQKKLLNQKERYILGESSPAFYYYQPGYEKPLKNLPHKNKLPISKEKKCPECKSSNVIYDESSNAWFCRDCRDKNKFTIFALGNP